jgi:hypothetical protein
MTMCVGYAYIILIIAMLTLLRNFRTHGIMFIWLYVSVTLKLL